MADGEDVKNDAAEGDSGEKAPVDIEQALKDQEARFKSEIAGLNRKNTELSQILKEKETASMSIEERIAKIEKEKAEADARANLVEAFAKQGLSDDWRQLFTISNPTDRAVVLKGLLEDYKGQIAKEMTGEFKRSPDDISTSKRAVTLEELKGKSPTEINQLWAEGRIRAS
jgi:small-conductance mechanosensitive channel